MLFLIDHHELEMLGDVDYWLIMTGYIETEPAQVNASWLSSDGVPPCRDHFRVGLQDVLQS